VPAKATTRHVGPTRALHTPSEAAAVAAAGDVVLIDAGSYADCAVWRAPRLRIEGSGGAVVLAGRSCAGKGIFVIDGADTTIRGITFAGAVVPDHNGAGIRGEAANLTVEQCRFLHNENGILAGGGPDSTIRVVNSVFVGNGACINACAHGIYASGPVKLLDVESSVFLGTRAGHHIKSRARTTIVRGSRIEDGPDGTASYLIDVPNGGDVLIEGTTLAKGARSGNPSVAIPIGEEGVSNPTTRVEIRNNVFRSDLPRAVVFVRNFTATPAMLSGNRLSGNVVPLEGPGQAVP
jgi:hypothetical protein